MLELTASQIRMGQRAPDKAAALAMLADWLAADGLVEPGYLAGMQAREGQGGVEGRFRLAHCGALSSGLESRQPPGPPDGRGGQGRLASTWLPMSDSACSPLPLRLWARSRSRSPNFPRG